MSQVSVEMTGKEAQLLNAINRVESRYARLNAQLDKTTRGSRGAEKSQTSAFGPRALSMLARYTGGIASASAVLAQFTNQFRELIRMQEQAGQRVLNQDQGRRLLSTVSAGDPGLFRALTGQANQLRSRYGMDANAALQTVFNLRSAGLESETDFFGSLTRVGMSPAEMTRAVQIMSSAFGGGAGTPRQVVNQILQASAESPVNATQIAEAATPVAALYAELGGRPDEMLSALSVLAETTKSADVAGTQLASLANAMLQEFDNIDLSGFDPSVRAGLRASPARLARALPDLEAMGLLRNDAGDAITTQEFLGRKEALLAALGLQRNAARIDERQLSIYGAATAAGTDASPLARAFGLVGADPILSSSEGLLGAREASSIAREEDLAAVENRAQLVRELSIENARPTGALGLTLSYFSRVLERNFAGDRAFGDRALEGALTGSTRFTPDQRARILEASGAQLEPESFEDFRARMSGADDGTGPGGPFERTAAQLREAAADLKAAAQDIRGGTTQGRPAGGAVSGRDSSITERER